MEKTKIKTKKIFYGFLKNGKMIHRIITYKKRETKKEMEERIKTERIKKAIK